MSKWNRPGAAARPSLFSSVRMEPLEGRTLFSTGLPQVALVHGLGLNQPSAATETPTSPTTTHTAKPMVHPPSRRRNRQRTIDRPAIFNSKAVTSDFFPIAVWLQPDYLMDHWKSVGVNTMFGYEDNGGTTSLAQWTAAATSKGLYTIRPSSGNARADVNDPYLLAYMLNDEPDGNGVSPAAVQAQYNALKRMNPTVPVVENLAGGFVLHWQGNVTSKAYAAYLAASDIVSSDIYPVTGWGMPSRLDAPGQAVTTLSKASGGKAQFAFIETSNQNLPWVANDRGVTPGEFDAEVWAAINHGAKGITYFPQQIGGFSFDATPSDVLAEMAVQNARIESIGGALSSAYDPATLGLTLTGGLQGSWRQYNGKSYFIVTNMSGNTVNATGRAYGLARNTTTAAVVGENRTIAMPAGGFADTWAPYQTHVYVVV